MMPARATAETIDGLLLSTIPMPSGNLAQLTIRGGAYVLVVYEPATERELSSDEAKAWYETTKRCGGKLHSRFRGAA